MPTLEAGVLKRIHVNQHHIRANRKDGGSRPVVTVKCRGKTYTGQAAEISGKSRVVYRPNKPLSCGARLWIETQSEVVVS